MEDNLPPISQAIVEAREIVKRLGIPLGIYDADNPLLFITEYRGQDAPEPVNNLESMDINEVSAKMNVYTNWSSFLSSRLTEYKEYRDCVELEMKKLVDNQLAVNDGTKVTTKRATAKTSYEYNVKEYTYLVLKNVCDMLTTALENSNKTYSCLSRHIEAVKSDFNRDQRQNNHNKLPATFVAKPATAGRRVGP